MIIVSTLYNEYIDRPKLTEQKNPFEYIVIPPSRGVGTMTWQSHCVIEWLVKVLLNVYFQNAAAVFTVQKNWTLLSAVPLLGSFHSSALFSK